MNYQLILGCLLAVCIILFLIQWFRQTRHALRGATSPLKRPHAALNWCLLIVAALSVGGLTTTNIKTEAVASRQAAESSSEKAQPVKTASSAQPEKSKPVAANNNRQGEQGQDNPPAPEHQQLKLDQNSRAALNNFAVPAQNQLQIVDAGSGNVLQTFPAQQNAGTVSYTFTKEGNYYLILTKGEQTKTVAVNVGR